MASLLAGIVSTAVKNETVKPGKGLEPFEPFDNPILPLLQLFRLGEVRTNKVLLACGILEPLKKGKKKRGVRSIPEGLGCPQGRV